LKPKAKFVVGGDTRDSTPQFVDALTDGLCLAGMDVVELGILPTPMIYFAQRRLRAAGCAIVTSSHAPAETNGLKWMIGGRPPNPADVEALQHAADLKREPDPRPPGTRRQLDISYDYVGWLQERWFDWREAPLRIVLDPMHGCLASRARRYLHAIFPHAVIMVLRDRPDATFGGVPADCSRPDLLEALAETVDHERADVGLAFDGDGDRIAIVDDHGVILTPEEATWLLLQSFGREMSGEKFVYDQRFSDRIPEAAESLGARALVERSAYALIRSRMLDADAMFGSELSGHYFYRELDGGDDALVTACRIIAHLAQCGKSLSELRRGGPPIYMTPELRLPIDTADHESVMDHVQASWLEYPHRTLDGLRVDFPDGWVLVRSSVTEGAMTFRFESGDWGSLYKLVWRFCDAMPLRGDALWASYEAAMGHVCHVES
jgi:phosphomannomutase